ncbi:hypothetical protein ACQWKP_22935, partial [Salmonella enterica subsp. enterica serovar Infantis]
LDLGFSLWYVLFFSPCYFFGLVFVRYFTVFYLIFVFSCGVFLGFNGGGGGLAVRRVWGVFGCCGVGLLVGGGLFLGL